MRLARWAPAFPALGPYLAGRPGPSPLCIFFSRRKRQIRMSGPGPWLDAPASTATPTVGGNGNCGLLLHAVGKDRNAKRNASRPYSPAHPTCCKFLIFVRLCAGEPQTPGQRDDTPGFFQYVTGRAIRVPPLASPGASI